jgi:hypothetical protein
MRKIILAGILISVMFGCSDDPAPVDCEVDGPVISLGAVVDAASCSVATGSIKVSASGGKEPYQFFVNDSPSQNAGQFDALAAGIYTVQVKDANGCIASVENVLVKALDFTFTASINADQSCLSGDGQITVEVSDGNPPYTFKLGTGSFGSENTFTGLSTGNHTIIVKDNKDCSITSWETQIKPIMESSCAKSGCHNGSSRPDLRTFQNAKFYAKSIKSKTQDKSMPQEGTLTQQQIDLIACWVDDGAINN